MKQLQGVQLQVFTDSAQSLQVTLTVSERKLQPASPQAKKTAHSKQAVLY